MEHAKPKTRVRAGGSSPQQPVRYPSTVRPRCPRAGGGLMPGRASRDSRVAWEVNHFPFWINGDVRELSGGGTGAGGYGGYRTARTRRRTSSVPRAAATRGRSGLRGVPVSRMRMIWETSRMEPW
jgi:hypothetical protein